MAASYRSNKSEIRNSITEGRGLFAQEHIDQGEIVSVRGGHIIHRASEHDLKKPHGYWGYPISDDFLLAPLTEQEVEDVMMFLNHSCEPNVGILGQVLFVAMRDIQVNEELTIDYAMFGGLSGTMTCNCGSPDCRRHITTDDWKILRLQQRYKGYFSSFIQRKIEAKV